MTTPTKYHRPKEGEPIRYLHFQPPSLPAACKILDIDYCHRYISEFYHEPTLDKLPNYPIKDVLATLLFNWKPDMVMMFFDLGLEIERVKIEGRDRRGEVDRLDVLRKGRVVSLSTSAPNASTPKHKVTFQIEKDNSWTPVLGDKTPEEHALACDQWSWWVLGPQQWSGGYGSGRTYEMIWVIPPSERSFALGKGLPSPPGED